MKTSIQIPDHDGICESCHGNLLVSQCRWCTEVATFSAYPQTHHIYTISGPKDVLIYGLFCELCMKLNHNHEGEAWA